MRVGSELFSPELRNKEGLNGSLQAEAGRGCEGRYVLGAGKLKQAEAS